MCGQSRAQATIMRFFLAGLITLAAGAAPTGITGEVSSTGDRVTPVQNLRGILDKAKSTNAAASPAQQPAGR